MSDCGLVGRAIRDDFVRIAVSIESTDRPCHVRADASQFDTAPVNMAVNARDAMFRGPAYRSHVS